MKIFIIHSQKEAAAVLRKQTNSHVAYNVTPPAAAFVTVRDGKKRKASACRTFLCRAKSIYGMRYQMPQ